MDAEFNLIEGRTSISAVDAATGSILTVQLSPNARFVEMEGDRADHRFMRVLFKPQDNTESDFFLFWLLCDG
jgi:hypothetical protein